MSTGSTPAPGWIVQPPPPPPPPCACWILKVAVTLRAWVMRTVQGPVPLHPSPLHPANVAPLTGVAAKATLCPLGKVALHVAGQLIPAGLLVTVPLPVPATLTVSGCGSKVKVAVTLRAWVMLTVQGPVPLHPSPLQPANVAPLAAAAVNVTLVPASKVALHAVGQLMPAGLLVTVPLPVPATLTVTVNC